MSSPRGAVTDTYPVSSRVLSPGSRISARAAHPRPLQGSGGYQAVPELPWDSADFQVFRLNYCSFWSDASFIISCISQETSMLFILHPPPKNVIVKHSFPFFSCLFVVIVVTNSVQHFLEAVPSPSLIFLKVFPFLTFKAISQLLIFNNSCNH